LRIRFRMRCSHESRAMSDFTPIHAIDRFIRALGANVILFDDDYATYQKWTDEIRVPPPASCTTAQHYTLLLHEHAHWTGHPTRLNRPNGGRKGDPAYAREEMIAIIATLHLCTFFGLPPFGVPSELNYAQNYLPHIRDDPRAIRFAMREGRRAALYLHQRQGNASISPDQVLFHSVDALAMACFTAMPDTPEPTSPESTRERLRPLIERFGTVPRMRFA